MPQKTTKSRLGRGLSALITDKVEIDHAEIAPASGAHENGKLRSIPIDDITPNPHQPRQVMNQDDLHGLAISIKSAGVMQPILVRRGKQEQWELIAGERRWRAARIAGLVTVPAIITHIDDQSSAEFALVENLQREDLNAIERGAALRRLVEKFGLTQQELAERIGIDRSSIANLIRLTDLEPELRELIATNKLSGGHGKALLSLPGGHLRVKLGVDAAAQGWSVRRLEREAKRSQQADAKSSQKLNQKQFTDLEEQLGKHLGTRVWIDANSSGRGTVRVAFYDLDHFESLLERLRFSYDS